MGVSSRGAGLLRVISQAFPHSNFTIRISDRYTGPFVLLTPAVSVLYKRNNPALSLLECRTASRRHLAGNVPQTLPAP